MKVLVVCQHYYPEPFTITHVCEHLASSGHDVLVVTAKPHYGYTEIPKEYVHVDDEVRNGVRLHRVNIAIRANTRSSIIRNYLSFYFNAMSYVRKLKEEFDVVYSMSLSPIISVAPGNLYAKKHHVKHVLHCLDLWPESVLITNAVKKSSAMYKALYRWSRKIYAEADEILISSPSFYDYFRDVLHLGEKKIEFCMQPPLLAKQIGEDVIYERPSFVYAGNIGRLQLIDELLESFSLLLHRGFDADLIMIGAGSRLEEAKALSEKLGLSSHVRFLGMKPRGVTAGYYANAEGIVVPLKEEGYVGKTIPNKLVSCLAEGKPILAFLGGDGAKLLRESGGAIFPKSMDAEGFADAFAKLLLSSKEEKERLGQKNRDYYLSSCEQGQLCRKIEEKLLQSAKK